MSTTQQQTKINNQDLLNLLGKNIVVRSNVDNSEKRGQVIAIAPDNKSVMVQSPGKVQFHVSVTNDGSQYIFTTP